MQEGRYFKITKLYKIDRYPYKNYANSGKRHLVAIGIGGNLGDVKRRFQKLFYFLKKDSFIHIVQTAPIFKNPPFGYLDQPDFYNSIIIFKTELLPKRLLLHLLKIEKKFGRKRYFKNSPRTLDIDIIFYDKISYKKKDLMIPHPHYKERDSVLKPFDEIMKNSLKLSRQYKIVLKKGKNR